jgi:hypothetical protein
MKKMVAITPFLHVPGADISRYVPLWRDVRGRHIEILHEHLMNMWREWANGIHGNLLEEWDSDMSTNIHLLGCYVANVYAHDHHDSFDVQTAG